MLGVSWPVVIGWTLVVLTSRPPRLRGHRRGQAVLLVAPLGSRPEAASAPFDAGSKDFAVIPMVIPAIRLHPPRSDQAVNGERERTTWRQVKTDHPGRHRRRPPPASERLVAGHNQRARS